MKLSVGDKVVYPGQGPCIIGALTVRVIDGSPIGFCHLVVQDESGGELFVPVDNAKAIGIRPLLMRQEIPKLLDQLMKTAQIAKDWKRRAADNFKLLASGSAYDLADIVTSLTELGEKKPLTLRENHILERAKKLLVCEISIVVGVSKSTAEDQVDQTLKARKMAMLESASGAGSLTSAAPPPPAKSAGVRAKIESSATT